MKRVVYCLLFITTQSFAAGTPESVISAVEAAASEIAYIKSVIEAPGAECGGCADYNIRGIDQSGSQLVEIKVSTRRNSSGNYRAAIVD